MAEIGNINEAKSYATKANLIKALEKKGFTEYRYLVVKTEEGRYTAVFPYHGNFPTGGYVGLFAAEGFFTI